MSGSEALTSICVALLFVTGGNLLAVQAAKRLKIDPLSKAAIVAALRLAAVGSSFAAVAAALAACIVHYL